MLLITLQKSLSALLDEGLRVPFVVPCCQFLKATILKTFNEIVLAFLPVESTTNILYVNKNFNGNLVFRLGKCCGKVVPELVVYHLFWEPAPAKNVLSIFCLCSHLNDSRNKTVSAFLLCFIDFETISFYNLFWIKLILLKKENY